MSPVVNILAAVRNLDLLDAALLVFKTLRVGFPSERVQVWGNALHGQALVEVEGRAHLAGAAFTNLVLGTSHDAWVESLVLDSFDPFWVCDTDVVFFEAMARPGPEVVMAGRLEPAFQAGNTVHVERLHPAVMWINPAELRCAMRAWMAPFPAPFNGTAVFPFVRQCFVPVREGRTRFYDTLAGAWQAVGGQPFEEGEDSKFEHIHCGTWSDLVPAEYGLQRMGDMHRQVCAQPALARGLRAQQQKYYEERRPQ